MKREDEEQRRDRTEDQTPAATVDEASAGEAQRGEESEGAAEPETGAGPAAEDDGLDAAEPGPDADQGAGAPDAAAEVARLSEEVERLRQQLLRAHADFDNFRRRTRQEKEELQWVANKQLLAELLPVVDNFERALAAAGAEASELRTGVEMVHRQLLGILEKFGVTPVPAVGEKFNPSVHEAVLQEPAGDGGEPGVVVQELQRGYMLRDKVLRPAMVKVTV
ncbi:MAG: nucleotide exchange factor GrpE [Alicyclobacillus macrosporangiidus]|uniref:nucleotide exchange factor GrpE n=1 Tax=Alicyclobacillus macrosporangiidus TaxID=392015 RepID=UPI0026F0DF3F|nr:nucleotide exchange factor GrpE [Alicyclobacillus macrosporangiidus]MCL6599964.1 nucleotide exchange factor GrpE [Alicyclobacillus macrosporangiidus]